MSKAAILPTPEEEARIAAAIADADVDDAPDLVAALADGRIRHAGPWVDVHLRVPVNIDAEIVERFESEGPGWEDRLNAALRKAVGL